MKNSLIFLLLTALLVLLVCVGVSLGSANIGVPQVFKIITHAPFGLQIEDIEPNHIAIVLKLRLPRVVLGCIVGASLALSGLALQSLLNNPIASPYTLGISTGASIGVSFVILTGFTLPVFTSLTVPIVGFISAFVVVLMIIGLADKFDANLSNVTIVLIGLVVSLTLNGVLTLLIFLAQDSARDIIYWQMGSLSLKTMKNVYMIIPFFLTGSLLLLYRCRELDVLSFGEVDAKLLGVSVKRIKYEIVILTTLLTGSSVALTGTIGFIGLVAPHIARKMFGMKHIYLMPGAMLLGAINLVGADIIARTIVPLSELPVGAITALIGGPFFGYVYLRRRVNHA